MKKTFQRILCIFFAALTAVSALGAAADGEGDSAVDSKIEKAVLNRDNDYENYVSSYPDTKQGKEEIVISATRFYETAPDTSATVKRDFNGKEEAVAFSKTPDYASWRFAVPSDGLYRITPVYYPLKETGREIETALCIDGEFPFGEAASVILPTAYCSEKGILTDEFGNDYNSSQSEVLKWYSEPLKNSDGMQDDPYLFRFSAGEHTITLYLRQECFALSEIRLTPAENYPSYAEYAANCGTAAGKKYEKTYQAENYTAKSDSSVLPAADSSSSQNIPFSYSKQKLNIMSGGSWNKAGQWIEWETEVPEDGFYSLKCRYSQSYNKNLPSHRRLYIDGKIPFKEAECMLFDYSDKWSLFIPKQENGEEALIWLTKGKHIIRLEAVLGEIQPIISSLEDVVYDLSYMYQRIIMIVGANPDPYRDYDLQNNIPDLISTFTDCTNILADADKELEKISGGKGTVAGIIDVLEYQLKDMTASPSSIATRTDTLSSNISSLSSSVEELKSQALDLDYFIISSGSNKNPKVNDSFLQSVKRSAAMFFCSFTEDYNTISSGGSDETINVWVKSGRDQAQVLNRMIKDMFVPEYGIDVSLKLVDANLIQAFLSGNPPDAAIMMARGQPVNLAIRGALADLSKMPGFSEITSEFQDDAVVPYCFNGGCYGLPDSQSFYMMFYRKDVLNRLGIEVPKTWDELYDAMRILQINNMDVGMPYSGIDATAAVDAGLSSTSIFPALLLQYGGSFYNETGSKTALTTDAAINAFTHWTDFYTQYGLPLTYSFLNRFRTGTMPIGIALYTTYNQIYVAAPEIKNLWAMTSVPGIRQSDGSIKIDQGGSGTAAVITSTSKHKDAAWKFLCWWTGSEAQTRYSADIESALGMAARYATANKKAFANIKWTRSEYEALSKQWSAVREIEEVPGSYYTVRDVDNAFRSVVLSGQNAKETLVSYSRDIDSEIQRKRSEFGLDKQ